MGRGINLSPSDWEKVKVEKKIDTAKSYSDIYKTTVAKKEYSPYKVIRESRDSELHPNSSAIVFGLDSTGSMHHIYEIVARKFGVLILKIFEDNIVTDPQIMFSAIDDYFYSGGEPPLQVTQFEVDRLIADQLTELKYTGHGGPNSFESYPLLWYFCSRHTSIDCYEKRGKKGFLLTVGDDSFPEELTPREIKEVFGDTINEPISTYALLNEINKKYDVYHISLEQGSSYCTSDMKKWKELLGSHALSLSDCEKLPELVISLMKMHYGDDVDTATKEWDNTTSLVVKKSLENMIVEREDNAGLVKF